MKKNDLIIERNIKETIRIPADSDEWINNYLDKTKKETSINSKLLNLDEKETIGEGVRISKVQDIVLKLLKRALEKPKRKILIEAIINNPGKSHSDLLRLESIKKAGFIKKTLSVELKKFRLMGVIKEIAKSEKSHPKYVFICEEFDILKEAILDNKILKK